MANYTVPWTLPPSFMPSDPASNGSASMKHAKIHNPHNEIGVADDGVLHVTIHQAKQIQNICIYGNQDVYAKFLFTHCQDTVYPTQSVRAGGQNPVFNQSLEIPVCARPDTILKCELWMMSCARNYLEDQLLGFVLVPLQTLYGKGKQTREYCLTSTDLFYTPAGTVHLSLAFFDHNTMQGATGSMVPEDAEGSFCPPSPQDFQVVMMDCGQQSSTTANLCKVEFLDLEAACEDQHLVSMYYKFAAAAGATFEDSNESGSSSTLSGHADGSENEKAGHGVLCENDQHTQGDYGSVSDLKDLSMDVPLVHVHASSVSSVDDEMLSSPREGECVNVPLYFSGLVPPSGVCGLAVPMREEPISCAPLKNQPPASLAPVECTSNPSPSSAMMKETQGEEHSSSICQAHKAGAIPFSGRPLVNVPTEPEATINQEHFVDLYLKSMQQFTDKLADMKFSFDIDAKDLAALRSVQVDKVAEGRKEGSRLYYGSRAFY